ncbi:MAG: hypothetical protein AB7U83_07955 [Vicinamibacterales bacterium]
MFRTITGVLAAGALALTLATTLAAQQREFAQAQQANQAALRQYSWKSRTELTVHGEVKQVRLEQVRHDFDGRLQKTTIGGESAAETSRSGPPGPGGALRKRVVARKTEAFKDMLGELAALAESYAHPRADRMQAFAARAVITKGQGLETGSIRIQGRDLVLTGDTVTMWVAPAGFAIRRVEIATRYGTDPVSILADYRSLENGLTYQARATLRYPDQAVEIVVETFDYAVTAMSR